MASLRLTPEEALKLLGKKRSKYNVGSDAGSRQARTYKGVLYDSEAECRYAASLDLRVKLGDILDWSRQETIPLVVNGVKVGVIRPDFVIKHCDGTTEYVEVKGKPTRDWLLRFKLFRALHPSLRYTVVRSAEV